MRTISKREQAKREENSRWQGEMADAERQRKESQGWKEAPDASGKAPRHKAAATKCKVSGILKSPMKKQKVIVESITAKTIPDDDPDLSYLTQFEHSTDPEEQKYYIEDKKRLADYGNNWYMVGVQAEARILVPSGMGGYITQKIQSGGLWGIESDSGAEYIKGIRQEQIDELKQILKTMGITIPKTVKYTVVD